MNECENSNVRQCVVTNNKAAMGQSKELAEKPEETETIPGVIAR